MKIKADSQELMSLSKIKVYYDGLCKLCNNEINFYKMQLGSESIEFIDICAPNFDALSEGLDPFKIHKIMHVRRQDGSLATRVDAFIEIWLKLPRFNWLAKIAKKKIVNLILQLFYSAFVLLRPYLPRLKGPKDCESSPYCDLKNNPSTKRAVL